jgi:uncharacterized protein
MQSPTPLISVTPNRSTEGAMDSQAEIGIYSIVRRYADVWTANDLRAIVDSYHDDVLVGERTGLIIAAERFERNGKSVEIERMFRYSVRDGKLAECWVYDEDQQLIDEYLT